MASNLPARRTLPTTLLLSLIACGRPSVEVAPGVSLELARQRAATISGLTYRLRFDIPQQVDDPIDGRVSIAFELADASMPLQIDFRANGDAIHDVSSNGSTSKYKYQNEHIVIPTSELMLGHNEIDIEFAAGSDSLNRNPDYLYTLFVPDRARAAFPLFDQPDLKARYELTLGLPRSWSALSNATIDATELDGDRRVVRFRQSDFISSYLFSFVVGNFESITLVRNGRTMTMLHRETDREKVQRNLTAIFDLHASAIEWLEAYTSIEYSFQKFDFALIPAFQYGGMEHVGSILYRASSLLLDEAPSQTELLRRASVIAHETAHMWFGNLVTMEWFNDVWMKEVFANFMAAKAVNPSFPDIDHDLRFLVEHYPEAYSIDRTSAANPIRQSLPNLNGAGQLYGAIIYDKAPIMMRQLERLIGEDAFREGVNEYLREFSFANAGWPALIEILDAKTPHDLEAWSEVWVNGAGRPEMEVQWETPTRGRGGQYLIQHDASGARRVWPQRFEITTRDGDRSRRHEVMSGEVATPIDGVDAGAALLFNSDGFGYGLFPADMDNLEFWESLSDLEKGSLLIDVYENLLAGADFSAEDYFIQLQDIVGRETNQLILDLALSQLTTIYWNLLPVSVRQARAAELEALIWQSIAEQNDSSVKMIYFDVFADVTVSPEWVSRLYDIWSLRLVVDGLLLSEDDFIEVAQLLAIKIPDRADDILTAQRSRTQNPDNLRKLEFLAPSLSADEAIRDRFFDGLADQRNRSTEPWVLEALRNLHHPLRAAQAEKYLLPSLELVEEIQVTGDIFFPKRWLDVTFRNHRSASAVATVRSFLAARPDYNEQLKMKILQAADLMLRANTVVGADGPG